MFPSLGLIFIKALLILLLLHLTIPGWWNKETTFFIFWLLYLFFTSISYIVFLRWRSSFGDFRILASDTHGAINVWDRRKSTFPCLELTTDSRGTLNSIQLNVENQVCNNSQLFLQSFTFTYIWELEIGTSFRKAWNHAFVSLCYKPST